MFCKHCGKEIAGGASFCQSCGAHAENEAAQHTDVSHDKKHSPQEKKRRLPIVPIIIVIAVLAVGIFIGYKFIGSPKSDEDGRGADVSSPYDDGEDDGEEDNDDGSSGKPSAFWLKNPPTDEVVLSSTVIYDSESAEGFEGEYVLSVSPSGKYILTADQALEIDMENTTPANKLGRKPDHISLYTYKSGSYVQTAQISFDPGVDVDLRDTVASCDELSVAWSPDESRILMSVGLVENLSTITMIDSDIYLVDFGKETIENLTASDDEGGTISGGARVDIMPRWTDDNSIVFTRYTVGNDSMWTINLISMSLKSGEQGILADMSDEGRIALVFDYDVHNDFVYYILDVVMFEYKGLYSAALDGAKTSPTLLLGAAPLYEDGTHPYASGFLSVEVSQDGRWALISINDRRIQVRDIPLADDPKNPQPDPNTAIAIDGNAWVPCHNVILFDLKNSEPVNPFVSDALQPNVVIATAAAFAPDGQSILCAVFGDGGQWTTDSMKETTLYQIRIDGESFDAVRVFKTTLSGTAFPTSISWLDSGAVWIKSPWFDLPRLTPMRLEAPEAFSGYDF